MIKGDTKLLLNDIPTPSFPGTRSWSAAVVTAPLDESVSRQQPECGDRRAKAVEL